jgi:dipeptidyl aminopeptidase/acylaminoacyl peptidase
MLRSLVTAVIILLSSFSSMAQSLTVEDMWKLPKLIGVTLSKSGKYLAATSEFKGRMNLVVIDMDTRKATVLTDFQDFDVLQPTWVGDERIIFSVGKFDAPNLTGQPAGGGFFVVSRDGKESRRLSETVEQMIANRQFVYRYLALERTIPDNTEEIIAAGNQTDAESVDLYRLNLKTGKTKLLTSGRPASRTGDWLLDSKLVPRVVTANIKDTFTNVVYYRNAAEGQWSEIARYDATKGPTFVPLAFESDDQTLQIAYNGGRDTMAVYRYNPNEKKMGELIAQHPRFDMGAAANSGGVPGVLVDGFTDKIVGYAVDADKPEIVWIDAERAKLQKTIDTALPGMINRARRTPNTDRYLVSSYSDVSPARWYILDNTKKTLEEIGNSQPWLDGKLVEQKPFAFKTRDGLEMTGYYFLPKEYKAGAKLPTVLHIHGGPAVRDTRFAGGFGYQEGQLFASRGYAVVVPNFRSTPGIGGKNFYAGFGSVGRQMIEDHEDALKWAIDKGFVDSQKVCISGASYGGYAALMTPAKNPTMFKCSIAGLAVTDLKYQLTTADGDTMRSENGVKFWKGLLGTDDLGSKAVRDVSPLFLADRIKIPVFLYAGQDDVRVPIDQINRMNKALIASGNAPKAYVVKPKEGHGFSKLENNVDLYNQILKFLDEQIGKSSAPLALQ